MKPTLYLIAGPNGSGKTTLGHEFLRETPGVSWLNADEVAKKSVIILGLRPAK